MQQGLTRTAEPSRPAVPPLRVIGGDHSSNQSHLHHQQTINSGYEGRSFNVPPVAAVAPVNQFASLSFDLPLREARDAFERIYFEYHLNRESGSMTRVAEKTGLERTHLYRKLKQLGVESVKYAKRGE